MPAAAVIPAPIAYIKVVAVKKLVVELLVGAERTFWVFSGPNHPPENYGGLHWYPVGIRNFTLKKLECFRQASARILQHGIME